MRSHLKSFLAAGLALAVLSEFSTPAQGVGGAIAGSVMDQDSRKPLGGAVVTVLNSVNAVAVARVRTDELGSYRTDVIPAGSYKVHFVAADHQAEFHGLDSTEAFDAATVLQVPADEIVLVDAFLAPAVPLPEKGVVVARGFVTDAATQLPLPRIEVGLHDAVSGLLRNSSDGFHSLCFTDETGFFFCEAGIAAERLWFKVRLSDPAGAYLAEYSGAGGRDAFAAGAVFENHASLEESLAMKSASDHIDDIVDIIPPGTEPGLVEPLTKAQGLLADENPNNDSATCGVLNGFLNQVDAKERRGELSAAEAEALRQAAAAARADLGC